MSNPYGTAHKEQECKTVCLKIHAISAMPK